MLSFKLDPGTTKLLWELNSRLSDTFAILRSLSSDELEAMHRYARVSQIGASTRIENAILTDPEVSWIDTLLGEDGKRTAFEAHRHVIEDKFSKDHERSVEEVAGCRSMHFLIYDQALDLVPLTEATIRGLHKELMQHHPPSKKFAGSYKSSPNKVVERNHATGKERVVFEPANPGVVTQAAMTDLVAWYNETFTHEAWSVAVASEFVFRFLAIHPFQDGNGRLGRGLFLLAMLQAPNNLWREVGRYLAIDRQIERHKEEYYFVLHRCSDGKFLPDPKQYRLDLFLKFMVKVMLESLKDVEVYRTRYQKMEELSDAEEKVLQCFREHPEVRLQTKLICQWTKLPRRTAVDSLSKLVKKGLLQSRGRGAAVRHQLVF